MQQDNRLVRLDDTTLEIAHPHDFSIRVMATPEVPLETKAVDELLRLTQLSDTLQTIQNYDTEYFGDCSPSINKITITPDFHKGAGIPIGSSCHGAGRSLSRGEAAKIDDEKLDQFLESFRVVTPVDPNRADIKQQANVLAAWRESLKKEAPFAYKSITPIIETLKGANMATPVAEMHPIMTVKG